MAELEPAARLIYDDECRFCRVVVFLVAAWDADRRVEIVPLARTQVDDLLATLPVEERARSWHLCRGEKVFSAGAVFAPLLSLLAGGALPARLAEHYPRATNAGYRFVADRRAWFGRHIPDSLVAYADRQLRARTPAGERTAV
jgi:predicted DCC family thiol-disulfide oxidoreductase YuxK